MKRKKPMIDQLAIPITNPFLPAHRERTIIKIYVERYLY